MDREINPLSTNIMNQSPKNDITKVIVQYLWIIQSVFTTHTTKESQAFFGLLYLLLI